jgi:hypothetical protein
LLKHQARQHDNAIGNYTAKVTGTASDCHPHQEMPILNSKTEWHQPTLFQIQNEVYLVMGVVIAPWVSLALGVAICVILKKKLSDVESENMNNYETNVNLCWLNPSSI